MKVISFLSTIFVLGFAVLPVANGFASLPTKSTVVSRKQLQTWAVSSASLKGQDATLDPVNVVKEQKTTSKVSIWRRFRPGHDLMVVLLGRMAMDVFQKLGKARRSKAAESASKVVLQGLLLLGLVEMFVLGGAVPTTAKPPPS
eukprot:CAMPEP_0194049720 /NCGR_PEP_ID=MMETSP0009_2-20130614/30855_1 /TAXON_ID=210454 /ORGANISM="Grammatophora oceanica, Strain CCMP 410" /LENGTH=143 /DNA_ID=CAMNT_0038695935 /DNA_START=71 /DNA_END=502 /DNA_ORIENTATION=-